MGRYDRVRVYLNGGWHQPSRMYTYLNGQWVDYGGNNDYHRNYMNVWNGSWRRCLLFREDYTVPGETYSYGTSRLSPTNYTGWDPYNSASGEHFFRATVYKEVNEERLIFHSISNNGSCYFKIFWQADGRIRCEWKSAYSSHNTTTITTDNGVGAGQWVYLDIQCNKGSYRVNINWNGQTKSQNMYSTWTVTNCNNLLGDNNIRFRGSLTAQLGYYSGGKSRPYYFSCNMDNGTGSLTGIAVANTSYVATRWV